MKSNVLLHSEYGDPGRVIQLSTYEIDKPKGKDVLVKVLASPINPADINMLEGKYLVRPDLPAVLGNEGVGIVDAVGDDVSTLKIGDRVIRPFSKDQWIGWWTEGFLAQETDFVKVPEWISTDQAAMLTVNPITAYQLLTRFVDLSSGDVVIQNAGNSSVAWWVQKLGTAMGYRVVSIARTQKQVDRLIEDGFDAYLDKEGCHKELRTLGSTLALNGVGGQSAKELMKSLDNDGVMVTYGAMSKEPVVVSNSALIYNNIWVTGFNRNKWIQEALREEVLDAYSNLFDLLEDIGELAVPIEKSYQLDEASDAIMHACKEHRSGKILFELT